MRALAQKTVSSKDDAATVGGYTQGFVIHPGPALLLSLFGYNSGAQQWIQFFDTAGAIPANGTVPMHTFAVAATDNYSCIIPLTGINFSSGIMALVSTTGPTLTLGAKNVTMLATLSAAA